jgi:hypothetical protein
LVGKKIAAGQLLSAKPHPYFLKFAILVPCAAEELTLFLKTCIYGRDFSALFHSYPSGESLSAVSLKEYKYFISIQNPPPEIH